MIKFNQNARLNPYIWYECRSKKNAKNNFEKYFFKSTNNVDFRKAMENVWKHGDIKLVTTERRRNYLESEPNYHPTKFFTEILLAIEIRKMKYLWINLPI